MRKLSPFKAVAHALSSVWGYRNVALRIGLIWVPVMLLIGLIEVYAGAADPTASTQLGLIQMLTGIVSVIAVCSMAVNWHRFILRDEMGPGLRLDGDVFRYAGNTVLIMLAMLIPALVLVVGMLAAPPLGTLIGLPLVLAAGGIVTRLSIKLPAVALGNTGFTFKDAWAASAGNFWPCVGVFALNAAILLAIVFVLTIAGNLLSQVSAPLSLGFQLLMAVLLQLFYSIFNASVFTSLYGFFVELRDF